MIYFLNDLLIICLVFVAIYLVCRLIIFLVKKLCIVNLDDLEKEDIQDFDKTICKIIKSINMILFVLFIITVIVYLFTFNKDIDNTKVNIGKSEVKIEQIKTNKEIRQYNKNTSNDKEKSEKIKVQAVKENNEAIKNFFNLTNSINNKGGK